MSMIETLRQELVALMKKQVPVQTTWVTVSSVDADAKTMVCKGVADDLEYYDVLLSLGNATKYPVVGTKALIGLINNQAGLAFMIDCQEFTRYLIEIESGFKIDLNADEILLNGDGFGGLVKWNALKAELDKTKALVNAIKNALVTWVPVPTDGGTALKTIVTGSVAPVSAGNYSNLENENVKHG